MPERIGKAANMAMAWANRIALSLPNREAEGTDRSSFDKGYGYIVSPMETFDISTNTEGLGRLSRELDHVVLQTQPRRLSKSRVMNQNVSLATGKVDRIHHSAEMGMSAPPGGASQTANVPVIETKTRDSVQPATEEPGKKSGSFPHKDLAKVAERVYRLMRSDLILEGERTTWIGG